LGWKSMSSKMSTLNIINFDAVATVGNAYFEVDPRWGI
jgi:hypothetical protein